MIIKEKFNLFLRATKFPPAQNTFILKLIIDKTQFCCGASTSARCKWGEVGQPNGSYWAASASIPVWCCGISVSAQGQQDV